MHKLYENIKKYRLENEWSQDELAQKAHYSDRSMITRIEKGSVDLAHSKILLFANIFGVDPITLMGLSENEAPTLSAPEQRLLGTFRKLDAGDQEETIGFAEFKASGSKYSQETRKHA